ncbi:MAG TPA: apolipoprotein N-acyltransferase [Burkholderiaceae bacterium]|nr:apolipoprotein N-acyltransferase [Burkholderiaceae bacterium]
MATFRIDLRSTYARAAQAGALGVAHTLSFAPWHLWWLQPLALAGLFAAAMHTRRAREAALLGFAFGLGWFASGVWWVYVSMHLYGQMDAPLAALATAAFSALLALYPALALSVAHRFVPAPAPRLLLALPAAWAGSEWLRGVAFTGFPWLASGYALSDGPLAGFAPVAGVYGITLAAALIAAALAALAVLRGARALAATTVAAVGLVAGGAWLAQREWTQPVGAPIKVRLAQGNVPQDEKFGPEALARAHATHMDLLRRPGTFDLAALPESVYPVPLGSLPEAIVRDLLDFTRTRSAALVFGVFIEEPERRWFNSAVAIAPDRSGAQRYSKRHLVPFGEFIPPGFRWFVDLMTIPIGDQQRGARHQPPFELVGQTIAVNICYEDLFGAEIIDAWHDPTRAPTMLLNLSNLAWFGNTIALPQHLQIARLRALETGRPVLRATNTGATAIVDARGRVQAVLPYATAGVLDGEVQGHTGTTPYVRYGDAPALAAVALLALAAAWWGRAGRD